VFNNSSASVASLAPAASDSLYLVSTFTPSGMGSYAVTMDVSQTETDDVTANNQAVLNFEVTDTIYAIDNNVYGGQWWDLDDGAGSSNPFEIGAVYEIVVDEWASSASVFVGDNSNPGVIFELNIYEYNAGSQTYDLITTSETYTVVNGDLGNWVTLRFVNDVELTSGTDYLVTAVHYGGPEALYIGYGTNSSFRGATLTYDYDQGSWSNQPRTPMIRLNLGEVGLSMDELANDISIYPNPTNGWLRIGLTDSEISLVSVYDITGKVVLQATVAEVDMTSLSEGVYTVKVETSKGTFVQKILKD
jgi:hypothetical protein